MHQIWGETTRGETNRGELVLGRNDFPDTANGFFQQKEEPKLSQEFKTRVDSKYKYAIIPEIVTLY